MQFGSHASEILGHSELARVLTDRWAVRVIFISGDVAAAAKNADMAEALVLKPYNGAQILEAVARLA